MPLQLDVQLSPRTFRLKSRPLKLAVGMTLGLLAFSGEAQGQELSNEIVVSLPPETVHVELIRLSKLRELPSYKELRQQYTGSRLTDLEAALSQLGIQDTDIDQILLAWEPIEDETDDTNVPPVTSPVDLDADGGSIQNRWPTLFGGLAAGRFNSKSIAKKAAENGIPSISLGELKAFCVSGKSPACVAAFQESLGAFGNQKNLKQIVEAREGKGSNLVSSRRLLSLVNRVPPEASIWGVAIDSGIADWFNGWPLVQGDMQLDWKQLLKPVEALQYSVSFGEKIHLTLKLNCKDSQTAGTLTQAFRGLRLVQAWMWQKQNPNQLNPLQAMDIQSSADEVVIALTTSEDAIRNSNLFSSHLEGK